MVRKPRGTGSSIALSLALVACSGGGGSPSVPENPPTATAPAARHAHSESDGSAPVAATRPSGVAQVDGAAPAVAPSPDVVASATDVAPSAPAGTVADELGTMELVRRNRARMRAEREATVHVVAERDPFEAARRICEEVVPRRPAATPVLLKPNLSGIDILRNGIDEGIELRTVSFDFLRGVIACLHARGHREITITDNWAWPDQLERWKRLTGLDRLIAVEGVRFVGLFDDRGPSGALPPILAAPFPEAHRLGDELRVPRVVARHLRDGLFISIPKMKMHRFAVMTLSIKNLMGLVVLGDGTDGRTRAGRMHREIGAWLERFRRDHVHDVDAYVAALERFSERIVDALEILTPDAVLVDGVPPVAGDGFALIEPIDAGVAIGSTNPVFADAVALEWMGLNDSGALEREIRHRTSPLVEEAARRFWGSTTVLSGIRIMGDDSFRRAPRTAHYKAFPGFEIGRRESHPPELPWIARAVSAARASAAPVIDGVLDEAAWRDARLVSIDTDWRGGRTSLETVARFAWTPEAVFFSFEGRFDGEPFVDEAAPTETEHATLYRFDAVEAFLDPDPRTPATYVELELGPRGHFLDIAVDRGRRPAGDVAWSSGMTSAARVDEAAHRFRVEARVPAAAFGRRALSPGQWRIGLYRLAGRGASRAYLARFPTYTERPNFHVPERFGWLRLH